MTSLPRIREALPQVAKTGPALALVLGLMLVTSLSGRTAPSASAATVQLTSVSGFAGHAFVYASVRAGAASYPAPTGTSHRSPYYAEWVRQSTGTSNCPWVWAVYVFDRASNSQVNLPPPNAPVPNFGTTTVICADPTITPVEEPQVPDASARLDLDLQVQVTPAIAVVGSPSWLSAVLSSRLTQDLNLYLNMAIQDWTVTSWFADFGDGSVAREAGQGRTSLQISHPYQSAGQFDARAVASISGRAQAAVYDLYGTPRLIDQDFSVQVGNHALAGARSQPVRRYFPPSVALAVIPALSSGTLDMSLPGFARIDALRGALTRLGVKPAILREGLFTVDGRPAGSGRSRLIGWRLDAAALDAAVPYTTTPGVTHRAAEPLYLQWNSPGRVRNGQALDYVVPMTLYVETVYSDAHVADYAIGSSFSVSVNFASESG